VKLAMTSSIDVVSALELHEAAAPAAVKAPAPRFVKAPRLGRNVLLRSAELAEKLAARVAEIPWPARSRELQALLGLSKVQFLRIANLAIAMKLVHRVGERAGVEYYLGPAPRTSRRG